MFTKVSFYGKQKEKNLPITARLNRQEKEIKKHKIPAPFKSRITGPSAVWKIFFRQSDAFKFAKTHGKDIWVFSYESETFVEHKGQRLYLATSLDKFWHFYKQLDSSKRHHYEVIPEGSVCHLYFDLEFMKDINKDCDGSRMTKTFIKCVREHLQQTCQVSSSERDFLQLDASTEAKFSCHLVVRLSNTAFQDNITAGNFVHNLCERIKATVTDVHQVSQASGSGLQHKLHRLDDSKAGSFDERFLTSAGVSLQDLSRLFVKNKDGSKNLFCDTGVYTKNRNFRLYLSSKLGKKNPLVISSDNQYAPVKGRCDAADATDKVLFLDSLVSNIKYGPNLRIVTFEGDSRCQKLGLHNNNREEKQVVLEGDKHSPYGEIDKFIESVLRERGHGGWVRRWAYFHQPEIITYDILGDRWCENIGRQHQSNNIMFIADLRNGVYYQKCHDPECKARNFKSEEWELPDQVLPSRMLADDPWTAEADNPWSIDLGDPFMDEITEEHVLQCETQVWNDELSDKQLLQAVLEQEHMAHVTQDPSPSDSQTCPNTSRLNKDSDNVKVMEHETKVRNTDPIVTSSSAILIQDELSDEQLMQTALLLQA